MKITTSKSLWWSGPCAAPGSTGIRVSPGRNHQVRVIWLHCSPWESHDVGKVGSAYLHSSAAQQNHSWRPHGASIMHCLNHEVPTIPGAMGTKAC